MSTTTLTSPLLSTPTDRLTVGVVGLGYLGAVHAAAMAELGHRVVGYDTSRAAQPPRLRARSDPHLTA